MSSLHSAHIHSDQPDPYQRCYPKEKVYPKEIPVPPPDSSRLLGPKRDVHLYRQKNGGFGFSLRRSTISERDQTRHTVLFAEPGKKNWKLIDCTGRFYHIFSAIRYGPYRQCYIPKYLSSMIML